MRALALSSIIVGAAIGWNLPEPTPTLTFLSVGQGSCAVLRVGGRTILFDAGPKNEFLDGGERFVLPKLRAMGVSNVDAIVLSHPDEDHSGGMRAVLKRWPNATVLANAGFRKEPKLPEMLKGAHVGWLPPFARLKLNEITVDLASPPVVEGANDNDGSVLAKISGGAFIGGDAPMAVEAAYASWIGKAEVITADHHGSKTSGDLSFLAIAHPKWTVVSVGRNNAYGHPNPQAMARYEACGSKILRTDRDGDIRFTLSNGRWERQ